MAQFGKKYYLFLLVFLGFLSAFGPFVTDMYLPTLPALAAFFKATPSQVQLGLSSSMLGLAIGQIIFGPLSDKYGRRPVLVCSLLIFALSTVGCIFSPDVDTFNMFRFVQGLGGSGGIVLARSISTDSYTGHDLAKMLGVIGAIVGIAPVAAPVLGGVVAESMGWKGIFWILFGLGAMLLIMSAVFRETHLKEHRHKGSVLSLIKELFLIFKIKQYVIYTLIFFFSSGVLFSYIASASFIIQGVYGYSELVFSLFFALNASGIGLGSVICLKMKSMPGAALTGSLIIVGAVIIQGLSMALADSPFVIYEACSFVMLLGVGIIFTSSSTEAMDAGREYVGAAAAVFGAGGFVAGSIVSPLVGIGNILLASTVLAAISGVICLSLCIPTLRKRLRH